ncbi:hypothetical protein [Deinococcus koreensis]|nr:hypothetical protein [Deinococcus koreensis]
MTNIDIVFLKAAIPASRPASWSHLDEFCSPAAPTFGHPIRQH